MRPRFFPRSTGRGSRGAAALFAAFLGVLPAAPVTAQPPATVSVGRLVDLGEVASSHLRPRRVQIWLPPGYDARGRRRYPVLYAHDGQNLFVPGHSVGGAEWGFDETLGRLIASGAVRPAIVVAIWNTSDRPAEYMPAAPVAVPEIDLHVGDRSLARADIRSDRYLRFLVEELKPRIDRGYRTRAGPADTLIMGSSMGGLISAYALARYPQVFGAAACLSTHWPAGDGVVVDWLAANLGPPAGRRIYFDHGTATLDALYLPYQARMDRALANLGWRRGRDYLSLAFPGAEHSERAWAQRLDQPLRFLLARRH